MDFETIKNYLEKPAKDDEPTKIHQLPLRFFDPLIVDGVRTDLIERGRLICSFTVPPRLLEYCEYFARGCNCIEEIEIEAKALRVGKSIAVVSVELRKKESGKIIAQGRHTKYLSVSSKL
ncbi:Acyl-coenzyme A thioesterase 13 [Bienertia sinuspersici]